MNVKFRCRKVKMSKDGLAPIEVAITVKGERKLFSTGRKVHSILVIDARNNDDVCNKRTEIRCISNKFAKFATESSSGVAPEEEGHTDKERLWTLVFGWL